MYEMKRYKDGRYEIYELIDTVSKAWVKAAPERGGIIIGYGVENKELLYLNDETFQDEKANVRGGIPILFPIAGQLENGQYEWEGISYTMKNHGFARNMPWEVIDAGASNDGAFLTIRLESNEETKKSYPFDFEVVYTYHLQDGKLSIEQTYSNESDVEMPLYPGFHPYFKTAEKNLAYRTDAKSFLDYNDGQVKSLQDGLSLNGKKESLALLDAEAKDIEFPLPEVSRSVLMEYGDEFRYVVLWTEAGKEFVCVEPWFALTGEFNRKKELTFIEPKGTLKTFLSMSVK
ncbi:aldose epimerase family protein [Pradoshia sp.]